MEITEQAQRERVLLTLTRQGRTILNNPMCEIHGDAFIDGHSDMKVWWCSQCDDENKEIERIKRSAKDCLLKLCLPKRLSLCSFGSYTPTNEKAATNKKICEQFCNQWQMSGGLILLGDMGTGKTHLGISICQELCSRAVNCEYTTVSKIIREIKSSWSKPKGELNDIYQYEERTEEIILSNLARVPVLVIDEVGVQYGSDMERIVISEIINDRYNNMLPTIVIGNAKLSEVKEIIGSRAVDRIQDKGMILVFDWESHRKPFK